LQARIACGAARCYDASVTDADDALDRAGELIDERRFVDALAPAKTACELSPTSASGWRCYSIALKHAKRWAECLAACDRAIALDPEDCEGAHWNAGIAATALGDWPRARRAWTAYGIALPPGEGPLSMEIGLACVRLQPDDVGEVVYGVRIDPCRARIVSVPTPDADRAFGDVILHDGEPRGRRQANGRDTPVFDELIVYQRSTYRTWKVTAECAGPPERDALVALFDAVDGAIEDWTESVRFLCSRCSLGEPHDHDHGDANPSAWQPVRDFGLALRDERDLGRLRRAALWWRRGVRDVIRLR
jgi:tetratricopeptide (TPR) repeat protein